jgi:hypothetical protein
MARHDAVADEDATEGQNGGQLGGVGLQHIPLKNSVESAG